MAKTGGSRTKKPCDCCKRCFDHLDENNQNMSCFLRRMTANSKHSMVVPKRFVKHFDGNLSGTIKLKSPNRGRYDVRVTKCFNKVVFCHGWRKFVDSHHIEDNDYLLFRHIEKSCFEVLILDSDGCERVFPCAGKRNTPRFQGRSAEYVDTSSNSHHETTESSERETVKMGTTSSPSESGEDIPSENKSFESDDLQTPLRKGYILSQRSYLSKAQEERVITLIQEIQPESTVFVAVIRKSHVEPPCPYLVIPKEYALAHFPHESTNVTLQRPGKSKKWHPLFFKRKDERICMLRGQWLDFVHDNHVQEGDICLFLPTKAGKRSTFTVFLIRAASTCSRSGSGKRGSLSRRKETAKKAATSSLYEESGEYSLSSNESIQSDHVKVFSEHNYVLSRRCHLTEEQEEKIVALVKEVQPEIPVLVVQMKKSNVKRRNSSLYICKGYAEEYFPQKSQFITLERRGGKKWRLRLHIRPHGNGCMLSTRWRNFVRDNRLRENDICLFQPMPSEKGFKLMVHLLRSSGGRVHEKSGSENSRPLDLHMGLAVQQGHHVYSDCGGPSKPPLYVILGGTCLTPAQDKAVQEKAMAIKAEASIFVAVMNKNIVGCNNEAFIILDFSDAAEYLPDGKQVLTLRRQGQSRAWCTNLHNRLMLGPGEWRDFACDSSLEDGDICLFEPIKNQRLAMLVHIIRSQQYS